MTYPSSANKEVSTLTESYTRERKHIEQQQDDIKRQRRVLQEIEGHIDYDKHRIYNRLSEYLDSGSPELVDMAISNMNRTVFSRAQISGYFSSELNDLELRERRLAREAEEKEREYKKQLSALDSRHATR